MYKSVFNYELPADLIAQTPIEPRSASRLLKLDGKRGKVSDRMFTDLPEMFTPHDLLVFNNTRVIPARLFGKKETGGGVEVLIERLLDDHRALAQLRASKTPKAGSRIHLEDGTTLQISKRLNDFFQLEFEDGQTVLEILERSGHVPLPPYIDRADTINDRSRYQTIYAESPGAVAAPTAGLHFDQALFGRLQDTGVKTGFLTLHVGAGTFQPLRGDIVEGHRMHAEVLTVDAGLCGLVNETKASGGRIIAVGTTVVRALESVTVDGRLAPFAGETDIFIYPGYKFVMVDAMVTNFHLPASTLLMLVCAFAGTKNVLNAYRHAVQQRYRFYSYGDAMFVTPKLARNEERGARE